MRVHIVGNLMVSKVAVQCIDDDDDDDDDDGKTINKRFIK